MQFHFRAIRDLVTTAWMQGWYVVGVVAERAGGEGPRVNQQAAIRTE